MVAASLSSVSEDSTGKGRQSEGLLLEDRIHELCKRALDACLSAIHLLLALLLPLSVLMVLSDEQREPLDVVRRPELLALEKIIHLALGVGPRRYSVKVLLFGGHKGGAEGRDVVL